MYYSCIKLDICRIEIRTLILKKNYIKNLCSQGWVMGGWTAGNSKFFFARIFMKFRSVFASNKNHSIFVRFSQLNIR